MDSQIHADESPANTRQYRFGAQPLAARGVRFRLWAPAHAEVKLASRGALHHMRARVGGWHECVLAEARSGDRYSFVLPDGRRTPDPASRFQPEDVHGPSEVVDTSAFQWQVTWGGRRWEEVVLYELHVGTFTPRGTFDAAIERLDHLAGLGVTAVE